MQFTMTSTILLSVSGVLNPLTYFFKGCLEKHYAKQRLLSVSQERDISKENANVSQKPFDLAQRGHEAETTLQNEENAVAQGQGPYVIENTSAVEETCRAQNLRGPDCFF